MVVATTPGAVRGFIDVTMEAVAVVIVVVKRGMRDLHMHVAAVLMQQLLLMLMLLCLQFLEHAVAMVQMVEAVGDNVLVGRRYSFASNATSAASTFASGAESR